MFVRPWDEKSRRILDQLARDTRAYITDPELPRKFGQFFPELFDEHHGFADIGHIKKRRESVIILRPNTAIMPLREKKKYKFYRL